VQATASGSIVDRMIGAARLDPATYEAVEANNSATSQAMTVVILAAIAGAIGSLGDASIGRIIGGALTAVLGWAVFSFFAYWVGTNMLASPATSATQGQVLRTLGFAYTPSILQVFAFIPFIGWIPALIGFVWFLVAAIVALVVGRITDPALSSCFLSSPPQATSSSAAPSRKTRSVAGRSTKRIGIPFPMPDRGAGQHQSRELRG